MTLYQCRHCSVHVHLGIRPIRCRVCGSAVGFDEVWTRQDERCARALEEWNVREVLTGRVRVPRPPGAIS